MEDFVLVKTEHGKALHVEKSEGLTWCDHRSAGNRHEVTQDKLLRDKSACSLCKDRALGFPIGREMLRNAPKAVKRLERLP